MTASIENLPRIETTKYGSPLMAYLFSAVVMLGGTQSVSALEAIKNEKEKLKTCETRLCRAIISKSAEGGAIACKLNKTWNKKKIKKGAGKKSLKWGFGDAQCSVDLKVERRYIAHAMTSKKYSLMMPDHIVKCLVETSDGVKPVRVKLAPKIKFKKGRAYKAWLKVKKVEGPGMVKGLIWTAARLEDSLGIFHREIIKAVNKFTHVQCVERYSKK